MGLDTLRGSSCSLCPVCAIDPLGHHAATCRLGDEVMVVSTTGCVVCLWGFATKLTPGLDDRYSGDGLEIR